MKRVLSFKSTHKLIQCCSCNKRAEINRAPNRVLYRLSVFLSCRVLQPTATPATEATSTDAAPQEGDSSTPLTKKQKKARKRARKSLAAAQAAAAAAETAAAAASGESGDQPEKEKAAAGDSADGDEAMAMSDNVEEKQQPVVEGISCVLTGSYGNE